MAALKTFTDRLLGRGSAAITVPVMDGTLKPNRVLETNVEFYTAVLLERLGFQRSHFTPLFATGRVLGWMAHYEEQQREGRLIRPQSRYIGPLPSAV